MRKPLHLPVALLGLLLILTAVAYAQPSAPGGQAPENRAPRAADGSGATPRGEAASPNPAASQGAATAGHSAGASGGTSGGAMIDPYSGALPMVQSLFMTSPLINSIIAVLSVVAVGLFLFFLMTINTRTMAPPDLVDEITKLVVAGRHEQAAEVCRRNRRVFIASVVQRCVENPAKGHSIIMGMIESEGRRRADLVWNRISYLADVSNVAPMFGLLGTVIGMIFAFSELQVRTGNASAAALSGGVGQAMSTTMFGLCVGILALVFYSVVKARATRTLSEAEQAVHSIVDHLKRERQ